MPLKLYLPWRDETSATPEVEALRALQPALATSQGRGSRFDCRHNDTGIGGTDCCGREIGITTARRVRRSSSKARRRFSNPTIDGRRPHAACHWLRAGRRLGQFEMFLNALTSSEFETFGNWWRAVSRGDQDVILGTIGLR
jgi:hypothetical protein